MSIALFLTGGITLEADCENRTALLNLCLVRGYPHTGFLCCHDGGIRMRFPASVAGRILSDCEEEGIKLRSIVYTGLPFLFLNFVKSPGIFAGVIVAVFLLVISGRFVWEIKLEGNETLENAKIEEILRENGFFVGTYIPDVDVRSLENRILISTDLISWIGIHLDGTVARVQVIESVQRGEEEPMLPANLIAACDGQIEYLELFRGESAVKVGQAVKQGELLVSGVMESERVGCRFTRASGRVMARTERVICVTVPLSYTERVYREEKTLDLSVNFFNFSMKIFKSTGKADMPCDIIKRESIPVFVGEHVLPLSLTSEVAKYYTEEARQRSQSDAVAMAFSELEEKLSSLSDEIQILSKSIVQRMDENGISLECRIACVENIAILQELEFVE